MFLMATTTYPATQTSEVVQKSSESIAEPLPPLLRRLHVLTPGGVGESGMKTYTIYESDHGKEYDALAELTRRYAMLFNIEGFKYQIELLFTATEAIPLIGLQLP